MAELTAEMVADALVPSEAQVSPDGRQVAFVVAPIGRPEEQAQSAVWLVSIDGARPARQVTAGLVHDRSPRWSPDGTSLYFLSDRARRGTAQLHRLPLAGGEAPALTEVTLAIEAYAPLPDDRTVVLVAADPPSEEDERRERERDDAQVFGERWRRARLRRLDLATREVHRLDCLTDRHVVDIAPAPDGRRLAVISWPTPEVDSTLRPNEVHLVDLASGEAQCIGVLPGRAWSPVWERDGQSLLVLGTPAPAGVAGTAVYRIDLTDSPPRVLTEGLMACPVALAGGRGSAPLLAVAEGLDTSIDGLDSADRLVRRSRYRGNLSWLSVSADGRVVATIRAEPQAPPAVWAGAPDGPLTCLTDLCPMLGEVAWGAQERLAWRADDGLELDGLLLLPPGRTRADGPFPLITLVHGGPYGRFADSFQLGWTLWGQWLATHGYAVLLPNPRGGLGHGSAFAACVAGAVGRDDYRDIMAGIDDLVAAGVADPARLGIGGWSQGGFTSAWAVGQTDRFAAAVMGAGVSDWGMMVAESDWPHFEACLGGSTGWEGIGPHPHDAISPISFVHRVRTPVLILHGERDERVPVSQGRFFARGLREYGVPFELVVYPREPHDIRERRHQIDLLRRVRAWFDRWLRPASAPTG